MNFKLFNKERDKKAIKWVAIGVVLAAALIIVKDEFFYQFGDFGYEDYAGTDEYISDCNVALINLHGDLYVDAIAENGEISSTEIVDAIEKADEDSDIKAIILDINSYGGGPIAGEEVASALMRVYKPTIAVVRESGLSAAYRAATGADVIFASKDSDVGSIGVTMSYLDNAQKNQKEGLTYNQLSSGKFKDMINPDKSLTDEEKQLLMRDIEIIHENFVKTVAENRGLDIEKVRQLADGSSMLGQMALENGLIDQIGGVFEAEKYLTEIIGEKPDICW